MGVVQQPSIKEKGIMVMVSIRFGSIHNLIISCLCHSVLLKKIGVVWGGHNFSDAKIVTGL